MVCIRAYPRSRGATDYDRAGSVSIKGLSPLARGNPLRVGVGGRNHGPIPARAGQPTSQTAPDRRRWAYPRSREATTGARRWPVFVAGLSPLARGNHALPSRMGNRLRPIPARAGQPFRAIDGCRRRRAYPRSRGATLSLSAKIWAMRGLSPLARGNHRRRDDREPPSGPIPARAGQPSQTAGRAAWRRAYPRSRGATTRWNSSITARWGLSPLARGNPMRPVCV